MVEKRKLSDLTQTIFTGRAISRRRAVGALSTALPVINVTALADGWLPNRTQLPIESVTPGAATEACRVQAGDVLLSCRGTVLRVGRVGEDAAGALASANVIVIRLGKEVLSAVLFAWLSTPRMQAELLRRARSATGQIALTVAEIANLEMPVPPMAEQELLAALIEAGETHHAAALRAAELRRQAGLEMLERALDTQA